MKRLLSGIPVFALALAMLPAAAANAPGIAAFDEAFEKVNDYTVTVRAHEVNGDRVQDRTYLYWFKKPALAKTLIASGDGKGSGGVWKGGDTVSGHQGGMLAWIHLNVNLHDARATSLRGYTIPQGLLQNEVDKYKTIKGDLSEHSGPELDGVATTQVVLKVADPSAYDGVTRMVIYLSKETHFPVRQIRYAGATSVADETFLNLKTNVGLNDSDF
jgi:outer membrane lipoprotein-sorting protein